MSRSTTRLPSLVVFLLFILGMAACGGGGNTVSGTQSSGNVAILITDAPTDHYDEIHLTITAIELLPNEDSEAGAVSLFSGEETIDLLQLRDHSDLFTLAEDIPVDSYAKVRLHVSRVLLVDNSTTPPTEEEARLPSGKLDLIPQDRLVINEDQTLYLEIDIDAANSLLVVEDGTGDLLFRPVAFLASFAEDNEGHMGPGEGPQAVGPLSSVQGLLRGKDALERRLLCPSAQSSLQACVPLQFGESTPVYDASGSLVDMELVESGTRLLAMGLLVRDDRDGRRAMDVLSAVLGTRPTVGTRGGTLDGSIDEAGLFALRDGRAVALLEQALVVNKRGEVLEPGSLPDGQGLTVMGLVNADPIMAALVVARMDDGEDGSGGEPNGNTVLRGELLSVDTDNTLQVEVDGEARWVRLASDGSLVISGAGKVSAGELAGLADMGRVRITAQGQPGDGYFEARQIIAIVLNQNDHPVTNGRGRPDR